MILTRFARRIEMDWKSKLFRKKSKEDAEERFRRREREVDIICNNIREKYPDTSRAQVEEIIDMTLSFVEREVNYEAN